MPLTTYSLLSITLGTLLFLIVGIDYTIIIMDFILSAGVVVIHSDQNSMLGQIESQYLTKMNIFVYVSFLGRTFRSQCMLCLYATISFAKYIFEERFLMRNFKKTMIKYDEYNKLFDKKLE